MAETQIYFIGTSKIKEIRKGGNVTFYWGNYSSWRNFKSPVAASSKKVKYNKKTKNKAGSKKLGGNGGVTKLGTTIPATAQRTISGVERTCDVRYYQRGYTIYTRTSKLKKQNKMLKKTFTSSKPYQYRLQYKDKAVLDKNYSEYVDGVEYIFFADHYYADDGTYKSSASDRIIKRFEKPVTGERPSYKDTPSNEELSQYNTERKHGMPAAGKDMNTRSISKGSIYSKAAPRMKGSYGHHYKKKK